MITEKAYLEAVDIVRQYHAQVERVIHDNEVDAKGKLMNVPKKGDKIRITKAHGQSKILLEGKEFIVSWARLNLRKECIRVCISGRSTPSGNQVFFNTFGYEFEII